MDTRLKKLRALFGLGMVGGAVGATAFVAWRVIAAFLGGNWPPVTASDLALRAAIGASLGVIATTTVGIGVALSHSGKSLAQLSVWRAAAIGAVSGCLIPAGLLLLVSGEVVPAFALPAFVGVTAGLGASLGGGLVAIAKRGESARLGSEAQEQNHRIGGSLQHGTEVRSRL